MMAAHLAMRRIIGRQVKKFFFRSGLQAWLRRGFPSYHPVIVRYHSVSQGNDLISDGITVPPRVFEQQVSYFAKHFKPILMDTLIDCVQDRRRFPENAILFTFDDGYADNYQAARVLKKYGMTGVFYITAGCIESQERFWVGEIHHLLGKTNKNSVHLKVRDNQFDAFLSDSTRAEPIQRLTQLIKTVDVRTREIIREELRKQLDDVPPLENNLMLTWQRLSEMVAMGMEIGGHTMTHCNLPSATNEEAWNEVLQCKVLLEERLGINVRHFAYPNGGSSQYYNLRIKEFVRRAGYRSAVTSKLGIVDLHNDPFELRRIRTTEHLSDVVWEIEESRIRPTAN
jgi:peptidoglycan/xylan/chitin deacetylase (PgdA/CDA1 family)